MAADSDSAGAVGPSAGAAGVAPSAACTPLADSLFAIGTIASLVFGLGPLVAAGGFGVALGYPGLDDFIYRQAGAATFGW